MNLPITRTSSITINRMMVPISIFLAIGAGFFQNLVAVEASNTKTVNNFADNNFAFGRPISPARRKRIPGSRLKGGRGLLTIEELEEEFEAVRLVAHARPKFMFFVLGHTLTKSIVPFLSLMISALATYSSIASFKSPRCLIPCRTGSGKLIECILLCFNPLDITCTLASRYCCRFIIIASELSLYYSHHHHPNHIYMYFACKLALILQGLF